MADEKCWPLVAYSTVDEQEHKNTEDARSLVDAHMQQTVMAALRMLEKDGKLEDVRHVMLLCYGAEQTGPPPHYLFHGITLDKTQYRVVFEDETEDSVYLKIVKIQQEKK